MICDTFDKKNDMGHLFINRFEPCMKRLFESINRLLQLTSTLPLGLKPRWLNKHCFILIVENRDKKKSVFSAEISPKNRLSAGIEEILAIDNRLRKKSVENR